ncbi:MAG: AI-2E family transporter [Desulfobacterales bacterium]
MEKKDILPDLPPPWNYLIPLSTRLTVWAILAAILYILRSFFLLLFLTFVFAYIQSGSVNRLEKYIRSRGLRVITVFVLLLTFLTAVGLFVFPKVRKQTEAFVGQFSAYIKKVDETLENLAARYPVLYNVIPELQDPEETAPQENGNGADPAEKKGKSPTIAFLQELMGLGEFAEGNAKKIDQVLSILGGIGGRFASVSSAFLLSLLFSFLIVFDLPRLSRNVTDLKNTKLAFIYDEVAENIFNFSQVMGQALEAQFYIALINTILTAIGIYLLGMGTNVAFLSVIVFFCSFIPVVGVFVSSIPICLIALQTSGGLQTLFLAVLMIAAVHLIEGYILNPKIYGARMRINPVIVLIILTVSGKLFHFWGLILGVPICTYFFGHAIRCPLADRAEES